MDVGENKSRFQQNPIRFDIETGPTCGNAVDLSWKRYHIKPEDWGKCEIILASKFLAGFGCVKNTGDHTKYDVLLGDKIHGHGGTHVDVYFDYHSNL